MKRSVTLACLFALFLLVGQSITPAIARQDEVKTDLVLGAPMITKNGATFVVTVTGTASLSKDEKGFVGTSAYVIEQGDSVKISASVNLPNGPPQPGKAGRQVVYTWTSLGNDKVYTGQASMVYMDKNSAFQPKLADIAQFRFC